MEKNVSFTHNKDHYTVRPLNAKDFFNGYLDLLSQLTTVGDMSYMEFRDQLNKINKANTCKIFVIEHTDQLMQKLVGTATLLLEDKFIHNCGKVGHIEDVVIDEQYRGKGLAKKLINHLTEYARIERCYKVILDCSDENVVVYEKCGYIRKGNQMAIYFA